LQCFYTHAPHALQCVFKDTIEKIPAFKHTNDDCIILADKFKNTRLWMFLKEELDLNDGRLSTNMPVITCWGTHLKTYHTVSKYKNQFIEVINKQEAAPYVSENVKEIILSASFWNSLDSLILTVTPLVLAITDLEGNKSISNVFKEWSKLEKIYSDSSQSLIPPQTRNTIRGFLNQRWNLIQDNIIYAAYALDPRF